MGYQPKKYLDKKTKKLVVPVTLIEKFLFIPEFRIRNELKIDFLKTVDKSILIELKSEYIIDEAYYEKDKDKLRKDINNIEKVLLEVYGVK